MQNFFILLIQPIPYGEKTTEQILRRCDNITTYLLENHGIEALVVACNTATSAAIKHLREKFPFLIVIGTEPGIKPAITNTKPTKLVLWQQQQL